MRILVLQNDVEVPIGRLEDSASAAGHEIVLVALFAGDRLLPFEEFDAIVILGGGMGAYDESIFPFLAEEKRFLTEAVAAGVPTLGLCLGGQLLADALGGSAYLAQRPEIEFTRVMPRVADDLLADTLTSARTLLFHRDTFDLPDGATLIASSARYPQAFRFGSAVAVQPHPEVTGKVAADWIDDPTQKVDLDRAGASAADLKAEIHAAEPEMSRLASSFFAAWFSEAEVLVKNRRPIPSASSQ
ncbi:MAG: type 1 glutamine amidotransferase [Actinomycetota bacterium]|nr:type 1 glutamine amidotransferase [Actinomycetota bacterium]